MVKTLLLVVIMVFLLAITVTAQTNECASEVDSGTNCTVITGILSTDTCAGSFTYDLINASPNLVVIDDGALTATAQDGVYETTFNQSIAGWYAFTPCDNSSARITVRQTQHDKLNNLVGNVTDVENAVAAARIEIISVNDTVKNTNATTNLHLVEINDNIISVNDTQLDLNATTNVHLGSILTAINALNDISANDVWTFATRILTSLVLQGESEPDTFRQNVSSATWDDTITTPLNRTVNAINDSGAGVGGGGQDTSQNVSDILDIVIEINTTTKEINTTTHAIEDFSV